MTTQTLNIAPVGQVEGDLDIRVEVTDGTVTRAWASGAMFRGFEIILRGKDPQAGLVVTPRACGICGASHLTCAAYALDVAWKTEVPPNATLLRNVGQLCETIQSIPRWGYGIYLLHMTNKKYSRSPLYAEAVRRWAPFVGSSYELGVTLSGKPVEAYAIFGGQWPHSSYMVPGGVMCAPTLSDLTRARAAIDVWLHDWLEASWLGCEIGRYLEIKSLADFETWMDEKESHYNSDLGLFYRMSMEEGAPAHFGAGLGRFLTYGYIPDAELYGRPTVEKRAAAVHFRSGIYDGSDWRDFDQASVAEHVARSWYEGSAALHPWSGETKPVAPAGAGIEHIDVEGKYSFAKAPRYDGGNYEVGTAARAVIAARPGALAHQDFDPFMFDVFQRFGPSAMWRSWTRFHEGAKYYNKIVQLLDAVDLNEPFYIKPKEIDGEGWGATEASRGALAHWIKVKDGKIENYQIVSPTTWNVSPRDAEGKPGAIEAALEGAPIEDATDPIEVGQICRSFDSCLVCTVHVHDGKTQQELSRFELL
ncbi:MAG: nickel-dependent hydrogenase large subunit [Actinomycetota bacterium]|nr:nickel-dependent hydrogenase large subunit [Actinomycetota bacterium]